MILEAKAISREYTLAGGKVVALAKISVSLDRGDFLVVTGPSGSGKSTLLNLLSGFDRPSSGEVRFQGRPYASLAPASVAALRNRCFGFIYQTPHLISDKTVFENVLLAFHYGEWVEKNTAREQCETLLEYVGMDHLMNRYPATLSGGEMQRVAFARALAREPDIIFADEPTGSLDHDNSLKILSMLEQQAADGRSVIMVTHDTDATSYGTRQLALSKAKESFRGQA